jgi:hypothetical protein
MPKTTEEIQAWCDGITTYRRNGSNSGETSRKVINDLLGMIAPGHSVEMGTVGSNYVITLTNGSTNGTYTITGVVS